MLVFHHPDLRWKSLPDRKSVRGNFAFWRHAFLGLLRLVPAERLFLGEEAAAELRRVAVPGATAGVDIRVGQLSQVDFVRRLASSRLALLPYHPTRYAIRGSAMFAEAAGYDVPVVVPRDTWIHDCLLAGQGVGVGFAAWTPDEVTAAVRVALDDIDALEAQDVERAAAWRKAYNAGVLLRLAGLAAAAPAPNPVS